MGSRPKEGLVLGEYVMTTDDFQRISKLLHADSGIVMSDAKATLVYSRLAKRLRALGLESFHAYCKLVTSQGGADERQMMLSALTTNLTRFFREPHHFKDFKDKVLPRLCEAVRKGGRARVWSAGCSNGAEAYSIAMTVLSTLPDACSYDVRILASDIDFRMVEAGREGVYEAEQVRDAPRELVSRWMAPVRCDGAQAFAAGEEMRELVSFRELNLIGDWPMKGSFDAIFCRNVAIYFDEETQNGIWSRFCEKLNAGGRLYIGHSERIGGAASKRLRSEGVTTHALGDAR